MTKQSKDDYPQIKYRLFRMVSVGVVDDAINTCYDVVSTLALLLNLTVTVMNTYEKLSKSYGGIFHLVEAITVAFFAIDYFLRVYTSDCLYPNYGVKWSLVKYITSFSGLVDLLSFLPYYLPIFFPAGAAVFRMFRVVRIFRLFKINAYYDSLNVITEVISSKKQQLLSSVFMILILMLASSLCMYSVEHEVNPSFANAFSGIWWSASTLLTVGYGDIYPMTTLGQLMGIIIAFLGVGMVAIPTGIISAGFVEQYQRLKKMGESKEERLPFIQITIQNRDAWNGKRMDQIALPEGLFIVAMKRGENIFYPQGSELIRSNDHLLLAGREAIFATGISLKKIVLGRRHPWAGKEVGALNISRQSFIALIVRSKKPVIVDEKTILRSEDEVYLYSRKQDELEIEE